MRPHALPAAVIGLLALLGGVAMLRRAKPLPAPQAPALTQADVHAMAAPRARAPHPRPLAVAPTRPEVAQRHDGSGSFRLPPARVPTTLHLDIAAAFEQATGHPLPWQAIRCDDGEWCCATPLALPVDLDVDVVAIADGLDGFDVHLDRLAPYDDLDMGMLWIVDPNADPEDLSDCRDVEWRRAFLDTPLPEPDDPLSPFSP